MSNSESSILDDIMEQTRLVVQGELSQFTLDELIYQFKNKTKKKTKKNSGVNDDDDDSPATSPIVIPQSIKEDITNEIMMQIMKDKEQGDDEAY